MWRSSASEWLLPPPRRVARPRRSRQARSRPRFRKTFSTVAAARAWRQGSQIALRKGTLSAPSPTTLEEAAERWLSAAEASVVRTRSGDPYKPSALRAYKQVLDQRLLPALGAHASTKAHPVALT